MRFATRAAVACAAALLVVTGACGPEASEPVVGSVPADLEFPTTNRPDVRGTTGAVSSDHPLASAAGMAILQRGGNAVDAAVAMAAVLAVTRPHMNGVGGDAFMLYFDASSGEVHGMNGSGGAGALATPTFFAESSWARG